MQEVCEAAHRRWQLLALAIVHRTGTVEVGQSSVVVAASSAHRAAALEVWVLPLFAVPVSFLGFIEGTCQTHFAVT